MHHSTRSALIMTTLLPFIVAGCARLPVNGTLFPGVAVTRLASIEHGSPVAWNGAGTEIAFCDNGIRVISIPQGKTERIAAGTAVTLAWSPDATRLAAAFVDGARSRIVLMDRTGTAVGATRIEGHIGKLLWRNGHELLITATTLRSYRFGGNVTLRLYRWNGTGDPQESTLADTTLKRSTVPFLRRTDRVDADMELSPLGDEIAFARIIDPPMYPPYERIVLRHLDTGAEREIATLPLTSAIPVFTPDGEQLLADDGTTNGRLLDTSGDAEAAEPSSATAPLALSPAGSRFSRGRLTLHGRGSVTFPPESRGYFSPTGTDLALVWHDVLYLVSGLPQDKATPLPAAVRSRLLFLRRLRSERLITDRDYLHQKERLLQP